MMTFIAHLPHARGLVGSYNEELEAVSLRAALSTAMGIAKRGNKYLQVHTRLLWPQCGLMPFM